MGDQEANHGANCDRKQPFVVQHLRPAMVSVQLKRLTSRDSIGILTIKEKDHKLKLEFKGDVLLY